MAVGRLDKDSEGLLLLTTDGKLSAEITGGGIEKEYWVQVSGNISEESVEKLRHGIEISISGEKYATRPAEAKILSKIPELPERGKKIRSERHGETSWISITITEGKFRQVRKMTAAIGHPTLLLIRVRIGEEKLGNLQPGQVEEVENFELK